MSGTFNKRVGFALLIVFCFTAGAYAEEGYQKVEALIRDDIQLQLDGEKVTLNESPLLYEGKTYLPVRSVALLVGADIQWNTASQTIHINTTMKDKSANDGVTTEPTAKQPTKSTTKATTTRPIQSGSQNEDQVKQGDSPSRLMAEKIRFDAVLRYEITYKNKTYPLLANQYTQPDSYASTLYFRLQDLLPLGLDLSSISMWEEEDTGQRFVSSQSIKDLFDEEPWFEPVDESALITGESHNARIKALKAAAQDALYIRKISGTYRYEALFEGEAGFYTRIITLSSSVNSNYWYARSSSRNMLYRD